jgi:hypothetical protein
VRIPVRCEIAALSDIQIIFDAVAGGIGGTATDTIQPCGSSCIAHRAPRGTAVGQIEEFIKVKFAKRHEPFRRYTDR